MGPEHYNTPPASCFCLQTATVHEGLYPGESPEFRVWFSNPESRQTMHLTTIKREGPYFGVSITKYYLPT